MSIEQLHQDYYDVHGGRLGALTGYAERLIESSYPRITVVRSAEDPEGTLLAGHLNIPDIYACAEAHGVIITTDEEAAQVSDAYEATARAEAQKRFILLQGTAAMQLAVSGDVWTVDGSPSHDVPYAHAEHHIIAPHDDLRLTTVKLHDVWHLGTVAQHIFEAGEAYAKTVLTLLTLNDRVAGVSTNLVPRSDDDLRRWVDVLGTSVADVRPLLFGIFDSAETLDDALAVVQQRFSGMAQEETIGTVLAEIRVRALAARAAAELRAMQDPGLALPSSDALDEWLNRLVDL